MRPSRGIVGIACASLLAGCTVVRVGDGAKVAMVRPGVVQISAAPGVALVAYRTTGIGLVPGRSGATLGVATEHAALLFDPAQCRIVVLDPKPGAEAFWRELKRTHPDICLTGEKP